jgi:pyruvate/2-oxoglutarate/acetoin dehydrogenase E1 component
VVEELTYREAVIRAMADELESDPDVVLFGEDVAAAGGVFKTTVGLVERFGSDRVRDTPIAEQAIVGCALGAAATGLRPVAEIMFADFAAVCFDQIANQAAKLHYMTGGQLAAPMTIRMANGGGVGFAAQHSQTVESWFLNIPGLKLAVPATAGDAYALLRAAIRDDDPVIVLEHKGLMGRRDDVDTSAPGRLGEAAVVRAGRDVTVVATQLMRHRAVDAAAALAAEGIEVEVIDPRTLVPLDMGTITASLARTGRLACVQECPVGGSWGATITARIAATAFTSLDAAPRVIAADDTPIPYSDVLEDAWAPSVDRITAELRALARE